MRHQISHLEFFDRRAIVAISDPDAFASDRQRIMAASPIVPSVEMAESIRSSELLSAWLRHSPELVENGRQIDGAARIPFDDSIIDISLSSPNGDLWEWRSGTSIGANGLQSISGDAIDFCRVVTQRRRAAESSLVIRGTAAQTWMNVAQAFAGPPGRQQ